MLVSTKPGAGGHKDRSLIIASATNVGFAIFFALTGVLGRIQRDILKSIYFTAKGVAFAPVNVEGRQ